MRIDDEVPVEVAASGICHADLICRDGWVPVPLPAVLGHEGAGTELEVGSAVTRVALGVRVAMSYLSCGACPRRADDDALRLRPDDRAAREAESGEMIKPVLRMG
jgi:aryl-alcohol dehydrogenase